MCLRRVKTRKKSRRNPKRNAYFYESGEYSTHELGHHREVSQQEVSQGKVDFRRGPSVRSPHTTATIATFAQHLHRVSRWHWWVLCSAHFLSVCLSPACSSSPGVAPTGCRWSVQIMVKKQSVLYIYICLHLMNNQTPNANKTQATSFLVGMSPLPCQ